MTRKASAYARKIRRQPHLGIINGAEWLNAIQRVRPYDVDEAIPGTWLPDGGQTRDAATLVALRVRAAFDRLRLGEVPPDDAEPHDILAQVLGVSWLRALDIAGPDAARNPMVPIIQGGLDALRRTSERHARLHAWGLDGPAIQQLADALDVYDEILMKSSPAQMTAATDRRLRLLAIQARQAGKAAKNTTTTTNNTPEAT